MTTAFCCMRDGILVCSSPCHYTGWQWRLWLWNFGCSVDRSSQQPHYMYQRAVILSWWCVKFILIFACLFVHTTSHTHVQSFVWEYSLQYCFIYLPLDPAHQHQHLWTERPTTVHIISIIIISLLIILSKPNRATFYPFNHSSGSMHTYVHRL